MGELIMTRRQILCNAPHIETVNSGNFIADRTAPLKSLVVEFSPVQEGTGYPSINNVRPIDGWTGTTFHNGVQTQSVAWTDTVGTVYAGNVDLVSGEMIVTHKKIRLDANTPCESFKVQNSGVFTVWKNITDMKSVSFEDGYSDQNNLCDKFVKVSVMGDTPSGYVGILWGAGTNSMYAYYMNRVFGLTTTSQVAAWLEENPVYATIPLATPVVYQIAPNIIRAIRGENTITVNGMQVNKTSYWTH